MIAESLVTILRKRIDEPPDPTSSGMDLAALGMSVPQVMSQEQGDSRTVHVGNLSPQITVDMMKAYPSGSGMLLIAVFRSNPS